MTTDDRLEHSFRLLEGALNSSIEDSLSSKHFRGRPEKRTSIGSDVSFTKPNTHVKVPRIRKSDLNDLSLTVTADEFSKLCDISERTYVNTDQDNLYIQFQEALELHGTPQNVFEAISNFTEVCSNTIDKISYGLDKPGNDLTWLINERNTWRLVCGLYRDRILQPDEDVDFNMLNDSFCPMSEKECCMNLYKSERSVRECQIVIDWLEKICGDEWNVQSRRNVEHFTDRTVAWENTLHQLQNTNVPYMSSREIVSSLDPDAPVREGKPIHDLDIEDEERLLNEVFFEIRCGRLDKAQELCVHCGQAWRAATLEGWRLHHDPNFRKNAEDKSERYPIEGNPHRDVWKLCAWRVCENGQTRGKARAVMGALCGHLGSLLPACTGWEDLLWAYTRVAVDRKVENYIREQAVRNYVPMPSNYWHFSMNIEDIMREVKSNDLVIDESKKPDRVMQELLILDCIPELLGKMAEWVTSECHPQFLRFLANLTLVLRLVGRDQPQYLADQVIKAYVKVLIEEGNPKLIAFYVSMLPEDEQIETYAKYLETVKDLEERTEALMAAENYNLDIQQITHKVVHNTRNRVTTVEEMDDNLSSKTTQDDLDRISALDWMVYYPEQRVDAIWQVNALVRSFIGQGKLEAAKKAYEKIPPNSVEEIMEKFNCKADRETPPDTSILPDKVRVALKEFACHKAYLDAHEAFSDWFHTFHNTKPSEPSKHSESFPDKLAFEYQTQRHEEESERWKLNMSHQAKGVKKLLYNVLVFPDGGWLVDDYDDEARSHQIDSLRSECIPQVCMLLQTVLYKMEEYEESLDLVCLIMEKEAALFEVFGKNQIVDLLTSVAESSKALLGKTNDPFGDADDEDELP